MRRGSWTRRGLAALCWLTALSPAHAAPDDVATLYADAGQAAASGRIDEADRLYRAVLRRQPDHDSAYLALWALVGDAERPKQSRRYQATRDLLPRRFREYESAHYVVLSNAKASWSREQIARLEQAFREFERHCRRLELRPLPLRHKLVCVLFKSREEYVAFASEHDRMTAEWVYGYYAPRGDRIVLFDGEREEDADEFARARTIATTIHEAIHQLHYHVQIQTVHVQYPLWIGEGLATSFETEDPLRAFGPEHDYAPRRRRFENLLERDAVIPLRTLVACERLPSNDNRAVHAFYCQSYALVTWLARHRPHELVNYLDLMRREPPGRPSAQRHRAIFVEAFGDPDRVEDIWLHDEQVALAEARLTRDPLEEQRLLAYLAWEDQVACPGHPAMLGPVEFAGAEEYD